ncbi:MCRS1-like protein [Mya arenaria]|uniref:MCRS1-like protein n=1 Tax=Mya arenaria TaxID=6604 RepID=A0ABY7ELW8_MYAAR|nr:MCRS1-like protein [Mya arenaria]
MVVVVVVVVVNLQMTDISVQNLGPSPSTPVTMDMAAAQSPVTMATSESLTTSFPLATSTPLVTANTAYNVTKSHSVSMAMRGVGIAASSVPHSTRYQPTPDLYGSNERRSSKRSIKRKRFDDEVVESSLLKQERPTRDRKCSGPIYVEPERPVREIVKKEVGTVAPPVEPRKRPSTGKTNDLTAVYLGVKFSCKFTLKEIQERWYSLLYDPIISKLSVQAMKQFHPDVLATVQAKALYSKAEETLLGNVPSTTTPNLETFKELLDQHAETFYPTRTPKCLHAHWLLMKQYHLLPDQSIQPMPRGDHVLNFSDAEDLLTDEDLKEAKDDILEQELAVADRKNKREIRNLEQELPRWQVLVDSVTGISPPDFDNQTLAVLRGRLVRYLMRSREITLGRATKDNQIDVDLSLEGPAWKISRRQGMIKLRGNGDFYIANEGKRPIYIDGKPILTGNKQRLSNNSVVEISSTPSEMTHRRFQPPLELFTAS